MLFNKCLTNYLRGPITGLNGHPVDKSNMGPVLDYIVENGDLQFALTELMRLLGKNLFWHQYHISCFRIGENNLNPNNFKRKLQDKYWIDRIKFVSMRGG